jgi:N-acetylglucosamine-6-phosphate deacetylase
MEPQGQNNNIKSFKGKIWKDGKFILSGFHIKDGKIYKNLKSKPYEASYIIPPFIDPHIHGGWGYDFANYDFGLLENRLESLGIFYAIPTISCSPFNKLKKISASFKKYKSEKPHSIYPFLRVEGPFINPIKKGAQEEKYMLNPDRKNIDELLSLESYKMFTLAPELKKSHLLVKKALKMGKIPSAGHSQAKFKDFMKLYSLGLRHMTHYPNAMSGLHHREIGLTGAGLFLRDLHLEVIADGVHNSVEFIRLLLKIKGSTFCLISDMIPPAHCKIQSYPDQKIKKSGRKITIHGHVLAGGATSIPEQVKLLFKQGFKPEEIIPLACSNSLKFLNLPSTEIKFGGDANFVILNHSFNIEAVYKKGKKVGGVKN